MPSKGIIVKSLSRIKGEIKKTSDFIHIDTDAKPMPLINIAIDKLYILKEMEYNIKQLL